MKNWRVYFALVVAYAVTVTLWSAQNYRMEEENHVLRGQVYEAEFKTWQTKRETERDKQKVIDARSKSRLTEEDVKVLISYVCSDWSDSQIDAMVEICWRESRYYALCQNPTSTAHGLFQFLASTYRNYGHKSDGPLHQTMMAANYIEDRYGSPTKALRFWDERGFY